MSGPSGTDAALVMITITDTMVVCTPLIGIWKVHRSTGSSAAVIVVVSREE